MEAYAVLFEVGCKMQQEKTQFINEITAGVEVRDLFLVTAAQRLQTKTGQPYWRIELKDRSGVTLLDGGMGTLLAEKGWSPPALPEEMNLHCQNHTKSILFFRDGNVFVQEEKITGETEFPLPVSRPVAAKTIVINHG